MQTIKNKKLTKELLRTLRGATPRERILHRLHSVALVLNGRSCSEVARFYGDSARIVAYWVKRFDESGLAGLEEEARSGRPSKLTASQLQRVKVFVRKTSESSASPITGEVLAAFIKGTFHVSLTVRQCRRIVKQIFS